MFKRDAAFCKVLPFVNTYRRQFLLGLACVVVATAIQLLSPWILKFVIDGLTAGMPRVKLAQYCSALFGIACVGAFFRYRMRRILIGASREVEFDIRNALFARMLQMPLGYYQRRQTGDLMSRATNDLNAVRMMIGPAALYSANTILVFIVAVALMLSIDPGLTVMALLPLLMVSLSVRYLGGAIHSRSEKIQEQLANLSAIAQEALAGVRVVRAYNQEAHEVERFREASQEYVRRTRVLIGLQGAFYPSMTFFLGLGSLLVLWLGSRRVITGEITLGEFVAFNAYLLMLIWPMIALGWVTNILERGMASWKRIVDVIDAVPAISDQHVTEAGRAAPLTGAIELRNVVFTYPGTDRVVLDCVSLSIEAGQTVALVGATGSGKSTLVNLLPRLHESPPNSVFLDGVDIREIPLHKLRGAIGFVPQEPFLFSDSIAGNVALAVGTQSCPSRTANSTERLRDAAALAGLDRDVEAFPQGYDTTIGERGIMLSGGQRQRTALARAVMMNPRILILDDALSAVDTYTEAAILAGLRPFIRRRTSIIVSHRVSTARYADIIVVLDHGGIVEKGTHDQLVRHGGAYAELYRRQLLQDELLESA